MKKKLKIKTISISLDPDLIKLIDYQYYNRSDFFKYCIIEELCKNKNTKEELIKLRLYYE
jgi:metal-responsive CopG/Arc/MetJ family transcriptional regulator